MIPEPEVFPDADDRKSYKTCTYCGQSIIPFKKGICIYGKQVGNIVYVNDAVRFAKSQYYEYVAGSKVDKLGIAELADN